jgi:hypothetical protein
MFTRANARTMAALRTNPGRPKHTQPCQWCKIEFGARELRAHRPRCPSQPQSTPDPKARRQGLLPCLGCFNYFEELDRKTGLCPDCLRSRSGG